MIEYLREAGVEFEFGMSYPSKNQMVTQSSIKMLTAFRRSLDIVVNAAGPFAKDVAKMLGQARLFNIYQQKIAFEDNQHLIPRDYHFRLI